MNQAPTKNAPIRSAGLINQRKTGTGPVLTLFLVICIR